MSSKGKRDRIQIIADILSACRRPQTQTYIRRQTNISYDVLQRSIAELLLRKWLRQSEECGDQKKFVVTSKGLVFLEKWGVLQEMVAQKSSSKLRISSSGLQTVMVKSK